MKSFGTLVRSVVALAMTGAIVASGLAPAHAGVEDEAISALTAVTEVSATGISPDTIYLTWRDIGLATTLFRIEIASDEAGPYTQIALTECGTAKADLLCSTSIKTGPSSAPGPFFVRVVPLIEADPFNAGDLTLIEGPPSVADPAILGPVPPTHFKCNGGGATACVYVNSVTLTWVDNSDEVEWWIMRAEAERNPKFGDVPHAVLPANTTSFSEYLPKYNTTYWYRLVSVRMQNIARLDGTVTVERGFSNAMAGEEEVILKVISAPVPPPTDPFGLVATMIGPASAKLEFSDQEPNPGREYVDEDGFFVDFGPGVNDMQFTHAIDARPGEGTRSWVDDQIPPDTTRCYRVRGYRNGPAYSGFTNVVCVGSRPKRPTGLTATALSNAAVALAWIDRAEGETSYEVERCNGACTETSTWYDVGTAPADAVAFVDTTTLGETKYSYRVFAENSSGRSASSNIVMLTTPQSPVSAPIALAAAAAGSHKIKLLWTDTATNETGFVIEYRHAGTWDELDQVGAHTGTGSVTYLDELSLAANETRCYRVRAAKVSKLSDPSNVDCATTLPPAAPDGTPANLVATPDSNRVMQLTWIDNATNEDGFRIEMIAFRDQSCPQNPAGLTWTEVATAPDRSGVGPANYKVKGLIPHTAYFFRMRAVNKDGVSPLSNVTACAMTEGPARPVFLDPYENGDIEATRCQVDIESLATETDRMKLIVNAWVPETNVSHTDVVWAESPLTGKDTWRVKYQFRRGVTYRLIAVAYGFGPNHYESDSAEIRDTKVLADCPTSGV
ncbi:MAG TPA: fibronectin type III domain-containing protein [Actinomycetota bacterium]